MNASTFAATERAARESYGKLLAFLAVRCRDIDAAQDALADAFAAALERWPQDGVPRKPEAWLLVTARHRLFDAARGTARGERLRGRLALAARDGHERLAAGDDLVDERLGMLFACAHPALPKNVRGPLMLQVVLGIDAARIASAFLVAPSTMSQRLVRAKRNIGSTIALRAPQAGDRAERLACVLDAIYTTFACGWEDPQGVDERTHDLMAEALWLGELVCRALPGEPEALGLWALMLHADARRSARRNRSGAYVPLASQDTGRWNGRAIDRAEALLWHAAGLKRIGRFQLEAAIQSAHAARRHGGTTDWSAIVVLYDALFSLTHSPVVAINRAVAVGHVHGPAAGLAALDAIRSRASLSNYQPYWAARADLCLRAGERREGQAAFARASGLTIDPATRAYLVRRASELDRP